MLQEFLAQVPQNDVPVPAKKQRLVFSGSRSPALAQIGTLAGATKKSHFVLLGFYKYLHRLCEGSQRISHSALRAQVLAGKPRC